MGCDYEWRLSDPRIPTPCPRCKYDYYERVRCVDSEAKKGGCFLTKLEDSLDSSEDASSLAEVRDIETQLALKFNVTIDQVRADVYPALVILHEERMRYDKDKAESKGK